MARKKQLAATGAPEWLVTYGDMMTLLLCFFVLLFSFRTVADSARLSDTFGNVFGSKNIRTAKESRTGPMPNTSDPNPISEINKFLNGPIWRSLADKLKVNITATMVREGVRLNFQDKSGRPQFELGKWELAPNIKEAVAQLISSEGISGLRNKVLVRGHTSYELSDSLNGSRERLAYLRARQVADVLRDPAQGRIEEDHLRIVAVGDSELMDWGHREKKTRERNRRFDIIVTEEMLRPSVHDTPRE